MLGQWEKLKVGISHLLKIGNQLVCQLVIGIEAAASRCVLDSPRAGVNLVDAQGTVEIFAPLRHPALVCPAVMLQTANDGGIVGAQLAIKSKGVSPVTDLALCGRDLIFIVVPLLGLGGNQCPDSALQTLHLPGMPLIKVADEGDIGSLRGIDGEAHLMLVVLPDRVCAKFLIAL